MKAFLRTIGVLTALLAFVTAIVALITEGIKFYRELATPTPVNVATNKFFEVSAHQGWQNTGVILKTGIETDIFVDSGIWTHWLGNFPFNDGKGDVGYICGDPSCVEPLPTSPTGALIGKVGDTVFLIGTEVNMISPSNGTLFLRINDGDDGLYDNDGKLVVKIITK